MHILKSAAIALVLASTLTAAAQVNSPADKAAKQFFTAINFDTAGIVFVPNSDKAAIASYTAAYAKHLDITPYVGQGVTAFTNDNDAALALYHAVVNILNAGGFRPLNKGVYQNQ